MNTVEYRIFRFGFLKIGLTTLSILFSVFLSGQSCDENVKLAAKLYQEGQLEKLTQLSSNNCTDNERIELYRFQAEAYAALSQLTKAKEKIEAILKINQIFKPDFNNSKRFKRLYHTIKRQNNTDIIYSVTKSLDSLDLAPANVHIITAQEIEQRGYLNIGEIFYDIAGISISESNGTQHLHNRGIRNIVSNQGILLLIDGIEQNNIWKQSINILDQFPLTSIERVELINGPQSTFYGQNALTAVINIVTKKANQILPQYESAGIIAQVTQALPLGDKTNIPQNSTMVDVTFMKDLGNESILTITAKQTLIDRRNLNQPTQPSIYIPQNNARYDLAFQDADEDDGTFFIDDDPQLAAYNRARSLDSSAYTTTYNNIYKQHSYSTIDARLNINDFKFRVGFKDIKNETTSLFSELLNLGILNTAYRDIKGGFNIEFSKFIANNTHVNINSSYQVEQSTAYNTRLLSYQNADLTSTDLVNNRLPFTQQQTYRQQSQEFRTEVDFNYTGISWMKIKSGIDFRSGLLQGNYLINLVDTLDPGSKYYHFFNRNLDYHTFDFQQYNSLNLSTYVGLRIAFPKYKKVILSLGGRYEGFLKSPSNYAFDNDTYYIEYSKLFDKYYDNFSNGRSQFSQYYNSVDGFNSNEYNKLINGLQLVFSPNVALVYKAKETTKAKLILKLLYNQGFQTVSQETRLATLPSLIFNNPFISTPTIAKNFEFKANYSTDKIRISGAIFNTNYDNVLTTNPYSIQSNNTDISLYSFSPSDSVPIVIYDYENIQTQGFQLDAKGKITLTENSKLDVFANYAYTKSINKELKQEISGIANHQFNIGANLLTLDKRLNINIRMNYVGDRSIKAGAYSGLSLSPETDIPAYTTFNGAVTYFFPKQHLGFQLIVRNIFDTDYYHTGIGSADNSYYRARLQQPSRQVLLKALFDLNRFDVFHRPKF